MTICTNFESPFYTKLLMKFEEILPEVSEQRSFKGVNGQTDGERSQ